MNEDLKKEEAVLQTKNWLRETVIGCGFCPFASKPFFEEKVRYIAITDTALHTHAALAAAEAAYLQNHPETETSLLIFTETYGSFQAYLQLLRESEKMLRRKKFEGIFQLASFHPEYVFQDAEENDAANFTNRSPYPMLHLLREESIEQGLKFFPNAEKIPERNVQFAREKGFAYMQQLLAAAKNIR